MKKVAFSAGILSVMLFILNIVLYERIIDPIPVVRGIFAEKTWLLSVRILISNILSLSAFLILAQSIARSHKEKELNALGISIIIYIMLKMTFEFIALFDTGTLEIQVYPLLFGLAILVGVSFFRYRMLFERAFWKVVHFTAREKGILLLLLLIYIAIQIPALSLIRGR